MPSHIERLFEIQVISLIFSIDISCKAYHPKVMQNILDG